MIAGQFLGKRRAPKNKSQIRTGNEKPRDFLERKIRPKIKARYYSDMIQGLPRTPTIIENSSASS